MTASVLPQSLFDALASHQMTRLEEQHWPEPLASLAKHALTGGKFLRPQLFFSILTAFDNQSTWSPSMFDVALSVEWIHAYSLIHDDLPCMDDDDFRRGRPTLHRLSDDAHALLVGDALLTASFGLVARCEVLPAQTKVNVIQELAFAAGGSQLIGGQVRDLSSDYKKNLSDLLTTHVLKTGALFGAISVMAAYCVTSKNLREQVSEFRKWGRDFGILYQLIDDSIDQDGVAELMEPSMLKTEIFHRMESLNDRARALGWDASMLIERFHSIMKAG